MTQLNELKGTYTLDPAHTTIGFVTRHAMVTKVRGAFDDFSGTATVDGANPSASSLSVDIKAGSFNTRNADRDGHVRGADFLDVENHPDITFRGTDFVVNGDTVEVTGNLTVRGTTRPVTIPFEFQGAVKDPFGNTRVGFEGSTLISRSDFGLTWNAALETGGFLVSDKVELELEVSAIEKA